MAGIQPISSKPRTDSISQASESSQTAADFIKEQLSLEAEAREALPYQFDTCTRDLGPLRQSLYACLTCNPPPAASTDPYTPAAVCYSCSISCHGEHTLVELFNKRNFICDCGTTRMPEVAPCTLRINPKTGLKGDVSGEEPAGSNKYNQNFWNRFCGCAEDYDPHQEKGTMFQCLGLGTVEDGGCGEDWWHPECLVGYKREEYAKLVENLKAEDLSNSHDRLDITMGYKKEDEPTVLGGANKHTERAARTITATIDAPVADGTGLDGNDIAADASDEEDDPPLPPGFPAEDDFDHFICYKCLESNSWIKSYAGSAGFLPPVLCDSTLNKIQTEDTVASAQESISGESKKRKAFEDTEEPLSVNLLVPNSMKRQKSEEPSSTLPSIPEGTLILPLTSKKQDDTSICKHANLPLLPIRVQEHPFSLFLKPDFREHLCRCAACFPLLKAHPQLLEEEDTYEPPVSEDGDGAQSVGTGSILDRGEAAFNTMDRVQAIQGAMAYAHLKNKVSLLLKPFAESGQAIGAEDIKAYFAKLRGDTQGIQDAAGGAKASRRDNDDNEEGGAEGDGRQEQSGY
ncbi:putative zinc finger in N-recognin-domain-containing protein [Phaeosphaeriaceae sp. PMI808]|nr:putative zinc finger in N-recognin-domain-containing protein [Phaeosphaeriaceae sp. PMI808]